MLRFRILTPCLALGLAIACLLGPAVCRADVSVEAVEASLERGLDLLERQKFRRAARAFEDADQLAEGRSLTALLGAASAHLQAERFSRAEDAARRAVALDGDAASKARAYNFLGLALYEDGSVGEDALAAAEEALRRSLELDPSPPRPRYHHALVLAELDRLGEVLAELRRVLDQDVDRPLEDEARMRLCETKRRLAQRYPTGQMPEDFGMKPSEPLEWRDGVQKPERIFAPKMQGPIDARGSVSFELLVDPEGCVERLELLRSDHPAFVEPGSQALERWVFRPAALEGEPVAVRMAIWFNYRVQGGRRSEHPMPVYFPIPRARGRDG